MIPTFLASRWPQQNTLIVAPASRRDKALDMHVSLGRRAIDPPAIDNADVAGSSGPDLATHAHVDVYRNSADPGKRSGTTLAATRSVAVRRRRG
jgi:hypothetical protein